MKRKIYLFLAALIVVFIFASAAFADTDAQTYTDGNLQWSLSDDGVLTVSGTGDMPEWDTPELHQTNSSKFNLPPWDLRSYLIKKVVIMNGITSIGKESFDSYESLEEVILPESLKRIGEEAFRGCISIERISIPDSVESIENTAFYECTALKEVRLPSKLTVLTSGVFGNCTSLKTLQLPENLEKICDFALYGCTGIEKIVIPESVSLIEQYALFGIRGAEILGRETQFGIDAFQKSSTGKDKIYSAGLTVGVWKDSNHYKDYVAPGYVGIMGDDGVLLRDYYYLLDNEQNLNRPADLYLKWADETYGLVNGLSADPDGGQGSTIGILSNTEWTVSTPDWFRVEPASGSGNGAFTLYVDAYAGVDREDYIYVSADGCDTLAMKVYQKNTVANEPTSSVSQDENVANSQTSDGDLPPQNGSHSLTAPVWAQESVELDSAESKVTIAFDIVEDTEYVKLEYAESDQNGALEFTELTTGKIKERLFSVVQSKGKYTIKGSDSFFNQYNDYELAGFTQQVSYLYLTACDSSGNPVSERSAAFTVYRKDLRTTDTAEEKTSESDLHENNSTGNNAAVLKLETPIITSPENMSVQVNTETTISWKPVDHAERYICYAFDQNGAMVNDYLDVGSETCVRHTWMQSCASYTVQIYAVAGTGSGMIQSEPANVFIQVGHVFGVDTPANKGKYKIKDGTYHYTNPLYNRKCTVCQFSQQVYQYESIEDAPLKKHEFIYSYQQVDSTCHRVTNKKCSLCGYSETKNDTEKHTLNSKGVCSKCHYEKRDEIRYAMGYRLSHSKEMYYDVGDSISVSKSDECIFVFAQKYVNSTSEKYIQETPEYTFESSNEKVLKRFGSSPYTFEIIATGTAVVSLKDNSGKQLAQLTVNVANDAALDDITVKYTLKEGIMSGRQTVLAGNTLDIAAGNAKSILFEAFNSKGKPLTNASFKVDSDQKILINPKRIGNQYSFLIMEAGSVNVDLMVGGNVKKTITIHVTSDQKTQTAAKDIDVDPVAIWLSIPSSDIDRTINNGERITCEQTDYEVYLNLSIYTKNDSGEIVELSAGAGDSFSKDGYRWEKASSTAEVTILEDGCVRVRSYGQKHTCSFRLTHKGANSVDTVGSFTLEIKESEFVQQNRYEIRCRIPDRSKIAMMRNDVLVAKSCWLTTKEYFPEIYFYDRYTDSDVKMDTKRFKLSETNGKLWKDDLAEGRVAHIYADNTEIHFTADNVRQNSILPVYCCNDPLTNNDLKDIDFSLNPSTDQTGMVEVTVAALPTKVHNNYGEGKDYIVGVAYSFGDQFGYEELNDNTRHGVFNFAKVYIPSDMRGGMSACVYIREKATGYTVTTSSISGQSYQTKYYWALQDRKDYLEKYSLPIAMGTATTMSESEFVQTVNSMSNDQLFKLWMCEKMGWIAVSAVNVAEELKNVYEKEELFIWKAIDMTNIMISYTKNTPLQIGSAMLGAVLDVDGKQLYLYIDEAKTLFDIIDAQSGSQFTAHVLGEFKKLVNGEDSAYSKVADRARSGNGSDIQLSQSDKAEFSAWIDVATSALYFVDNKSPKNLIKTTLAGIKAVDRSIVNEICGDTLPDELLNELAKRDLVVNTERIIKLDSNIGFTKSIGDKLKSIDQRLTDAKYVKDGLVEDRRSDFDKLIDSEYWWTKD